MFVSFVGFRFWVVVSPSPFLPHPPPTPPLLASNFMGTSRGDIEFSVDFYATHFFSQCSITMMKQPLMRKGGEISLEREWRINK